MKIQTLQILREIANNLEKQECPDCNGHNQHEYCRPPDVAAAIKEVLEEYESRGYYPY